MQRETTLKCNFPLVKFGYFQQLKKESPPSNTLRKMFLSPNTSRWRRSNNCAPHSDSLILCMQTQSVPVLTRYTWTETVRVSVRLFPKVSVGAASFPHPDTHIPLQQKMPRSAFSTPQHSQSESKMQLKDVVQSKCTAIQKFLRLSQSIAHAPSTSNQMRRGLSRDR